MSECFINKLNLDFYPDPEDNIMDSIFKQYEKVIVESLISSFGLDFIIKDKYGGDVDTIHNVREIGKDKKMTYKNKINKLNYENRGKYNSSEYHKDKRYIEKNRQVKKDKESGILYDSYTGKKIGKNEKSDLDHTISAIEIHDDQGRVLAGFNGKDLANSKENLNVTNPHTNRTKKEKSMPEFLDKKGNEYTDKQKMNMKKKDEIARKSYELKLAKEYYTSNKFAKDVTVAAGSVGVKMGVRQALGFVFAEIWFAVKEEFEKIGEEFDFSNLLISIKQGIGRGFKNAKEKYKELFDKFKEGAIAGALSSFTTTLCNIFFTTARNVIKVIRQSYASIVQAGKILFINPDNLPFGERIRATVKIIATGASVVAGNIVTEILSKTPLSGLPVVGESVQNFCGILVTGILSCTLLYYFDRSKIMNKLVGLLNNMHIVETEVNYFHIQAEYFEKYAAELMNINLNEFKKEISIYSDIVSDISKSKSEEELNVLLKKALDLIDVKIPWEGNFDDFMNDKNQRVVFE